MEQGIFECGRRALRARLLAMLNEDAPQIFDYAQQRIAHLLDHDTAQQYSEQAHITAQRKVFGGIGGAGGQFVKPPALIVGAPKRGLTHTQS
jgi:hypothetical protein